MNRSLPAVQHVAYARANWSRWIVDCPSLYCRSALMMPPGASEFRCWRCHTRAPIVWPADPAAIERVLCMRPDEATRSWEPGETIMDLIMENLAHGLFGPVHDALTANGGALRFLESAPRPPAWHGEAGPELRAIEG